MTLSVDIVKKKGKPRQFKLSERLVAMLFYLPEKNDCIWNGKSRNIESFRSNFCTKENA